MAKADIAAVLALGAAFFIAIGNVAHQRAAQGLTDQPAGNMALFLRLLRDRRWLLGSVASVLGFGLQAAALGLGSVLLVQALLVTALLFALPINARLSATPVSRAQWVWAVLLAVSVAVIVTVGNPAAGQSRAGLQVWAVVAAVMLPVLALCVAGARMMSGRPAAAVLLGLVSGSLWGVFAVLTKSVVGRIGDGIWALLATPELYAWVAVAVAASSWQQSSFRAGSLTASLPTLTVTEPLVAALLGILVLGETVHPGEDGWWALALAVAVMVSSTAALARGAAATAAVTGTRRQARQ